MHVSGKYKYVQKEIYKLLKSYGFKKSKSKFVLELPEAHVVITYGNPRLFDKSINVADVRFWVLSGEFYLKILDPVFREKQRVDEFSPDSDCWFDIGFDKLNKREKIQEINQNTDIEQQFEEVKDFIQPKLEQLSTEATISYIYALHGDLTLENIKTWEARGMLQMAILAKLTGKDC